VAPAKLAATSSFVVQNLVLLFDRSGWQEANQPASIQLTGVMGP
jgi:hypothetical protein